MQHSLIIYDASYLVHVGTASAHYDSDVIMGTKYGGLSFLMEKVFLHMSEGRSVAVAMDSKCDKKEIFKEYKSTRKLDAEIMVQLNAIKTFCEQTKIPIYQKEGYEADEIIYNLVHENSEIYNVIDIYCYDADIDCCIIRKGIRCIGCTSTAPTIDVDNYNYAIKRGEFIPYNCILPFIVVKGKPSNNIPVIKLECGAPPATIFNSYVDYCNRNAVTEGARSEKKYIIRWLLGKKSQLPEADFDTLLRRVNMIYPRQILRSDMNLTVPYDCKSKLNTERMIFYMAAFGLKASAMNMGVASEVNELAANKSREINSLLLFYKNMLVSGDMFASGEMHTTTNENCYEGTSVFTLGSF